MKAIYILCNKHYLFAFIASVISFYALFYINLSILSLYAPIMIFSLTYHYRDIIKMGYLKNDSKIISLLMKHKSYVCIEIVLYIVLASVASLLCFFFFNEHKLTEPSLFNKIISISFHLFFIVFAFIDFLTEEVDKKRTTLKYTLNNVIKSCKQLFVYHYVAFFSIVSIVTLLSNYLHYSITCCLLTLLGFTYLLSIKQKDF